MSQKELILTDNSLFLIPSYASDLITLHVYRAVTKISQREQASIKTKTKNIEKDRLPTFRQTCMSNTDYDYKHLK